MGRLPLEGIRVVDTSAIFAFPYAAGVMADLGAEVIKIEGPTRVEPIRTGMLSGAYPENDPGADPWNRTPTFHVVNRGKKSLVLDLRNPEGLKVLKELVLSADVFMENFTPRVTRNWGMDWPKLKEMKPDIIMMSNTGYGHGKGPYSDYPAVATSQEATHGLTHLTGYNGDVPSKVGQSYVDFVASWTCLFALSMALRHRKKTGKGMWVDIGMYQLGVFHISEYLMDWIANGKDNSQRIGNRHPWFAPQGCYPCADEDGWAVLSVRDDHEWEALCRTIGREDLVDDPKYIGHLNRWKHHDELDGIIKEWTTKHSKWDVMEKLQDAGVPAGPVMDSRDMNTNVHYWQRGFLEKVPSDDPTLGTRVLMGRPWKLSNTPVSIKGPGPKLGEGNRRYIVDELGHSEEEYQKLIEEGVTADSPVDKRPIPTSSLDDMVSKGVYGYWDPEYKEKLGI